MKELRILPKRSKSSKSKDCTKRVSLVSGEQRKSSIRILRSGRKVSYIHDYEDESKSDNDRDNSYKPNHSDQGISDSSSDIEEYEKLSASKNPTSSQQNSAQTVTASSPEKLFFDPLPGLHEAIDRMRDKIKDVDPASLFLTSLDAKLIPVAQCHIDALKYRKNFKENRHELTETLKKLYNERVFDNKLLDVPVSWNKKFRRTAGYCRYGKRGANRYATVELSEKLISEPCRLRDTLIHEFCHAAAWIFNGVTGHGNEWKSWGRKAVQSLSGLPEITKINYYKIDYKYTYKCNCCGLTLQAHSNSRKNERLRCSNCPGVMEVFLNKRNKDGRINLAPLRKPMGFAKFVKDNYKLNMACGRSHADIMKTLSVKFVEAKRIINK